MPLRFLCTCLAKIIKNGTYTKPLYLRFVKLVHTSSSGHVIMSRYSKYVCSEMNIHK